MRLGMAALIMASVFVADGLRATAWTGRQTFTLRQYLRFDGSDDRDLDEGRAIVRIDTTDEREVLAVGAIRVRSSASALVAEFRDVANLKRSESILANSRGRVCQRGPHG
jgi:hypothetical protein